MDQTVDNDRMNKKEINYEDYWFNRSAIEPTIVTSIIAGICFICSIISANMTDVINKPTNQSTIAFLPNFSSIFINYYDDLSVNASFGSLNLTCSNLTISTTFVHTLPSLLRIIELNVAANIFIRYATCLPLAVRFFNSLCYTNLYNVVVDSNQKDDCIYLRRIICDLLFISHTIEMISIGIVSIVSIRNDFSELYYLSLRLFAIFGIIHQFIMIGLQLATSHYSNKNSTNFQSILSLNIKMVSSAIFTMTAPFAISSHQEFVEDVVCNFQIPISYALIEYLMFASNVAFHLTSLIDLKQLTICAFPSARSSGETRSSSLIATDINQYYSHHRIVHNGINNIS